MPPGKPIEPNTADELVFLPRLTQSLLMFFPAALPLLPSPPPPPAEDPEPPAVIISHLGSQSRAGIAVATVAELESHC